MSSLDTATHEIPVVTLPSGERPRRDAGIPMLLARHAGFPVVIVLSAVLNIHRLSQNGYANIFYSAGVKSMLRSWHNFFWVSFDPGGLITIDKPPLGLWVQGISAKLFGFSPMALLLPEAIIGVLTVALLYVIVARRFGGAAAFASALALAVFPSFVAVARDNGVDPLLILLMLLACATGLRAAETGRLRWLLGSAAFVGLAFNTKTLAAYLCVPGIAAGYLMCAPVSWRRRILGLLAGGVVLLAVSFAWIAAFEATPASKRPFAGSSTNNTQLGLTFEYNGFGRVEGQLGGPDNVKTLPGARPLFHHHGHTPPAAAQSTVGAAHSPTSGPGSSTFLANGRYRNPIPFGSPPSPVRLWGKGLGDQDGWTIPLALFGTIALVVLALRERRKAGRPLTHDAARRTSGPEPEAPGATAPDSAPGVEQHDAETSTNGASADATSADPARPARIDRRGELLPFLYVFGGWFLVEVFVLSASKGIVHPYYVSALGPATAAMAGVGALALVRLRESSRPLWAIVLAALAVAGTIAAQAVLLQREHYIVSLVPVMIVLGVGGLIAFTVSRRLVRPAIVALFALFLIAPLAYSRTTWWAPVEGTFPAAGPKFAVGTGGVGIADPELAVDKALITYIRGHHPGTRYPLLTVASTQAAPFILMNLDAAALGGYSGSDPALDGPGMARLVEHGEARYVLLGGDYSTRGGNKATAAVLRSCKQLSLRTWHSPIRYVLDALTLFDCEGDASALRG